jgi:hypothetical protein
MISTFLVKEGRARASQVVAAFAIGAVLTSAVVGAAVAALGTAAEIPHGRVALIGLGVLAGALAIADATGRTPTVRRQTKSHWWVSTGPRRAGLIWGADLGFGFTTIRIASVYWIAIAAACIFEPPASAAISLGFYGVGLSVNLIFGVTMLRRRFGNRVVLGATRLATPISHAAAICLAGTGFVLITAGAFGA